MAIMEPFEPLLVRCFAGLSLIVFRALAVLTSIRVEQKQNIQ